VKATNAYSAKRALFNVLAALAEGASDGSALRRDGVKVQMSYDYPAPLLSECVFGGGVRFTQSEAGHDGHLAMRVETTTIGIYVRVMRAADSARITDARVEEIADFLGDWLAENPDLGGVFTFAEIGSGQGDYFPSDSERTSTLALQVVVWSYLF
jgi:hypothetical protein